MAGPIVRLNVEVWSSGQVVSLCLGSAPPRTRAPCSFGSVVAEAPLANDYLFLLAACFLFLLKPCWFLCVFQLLSVVSCLCLTGRSYLGVPAWLGQHQQSQWPAHGPADVPIRYTYRVTCRLIYHGRGHYSLTHMLLCNSKVLLHLKMCFACCYFTWIFVLHKDYRCVEFDTR